MNLALPGRGAKVASAAADDDDVADEAAVGDEAAMLAAGFHAPELGRAAAAAADAFRPELDRSKGGGETYEKHEN